MTAVDGSKFTHYSAPTHSDTYIIITAMDEGQTTLNEYILQSLCQQHGYE